jgi:hypothetical protein
MKILGEPWSLSALVAIFLPLRHKETKKSPRI